MRSSEIWIIVKKELAKFFGNKRVLFSTVILPGLVIYIVYSMMGNLMHKKQTADQNYNSTVYVTNLPQDIAVIMDETNMKYKEIPVSKKESLKKKIQDKQEVLLVCFPENFIVPGDVHGTLPNIEIYYNDSFAESNTYFLNMCAILENYENSIINIFRINEGEEQYNLASKGENTAKELSTLLPTIIMGLLFSACLSVAAESIAGEKERGTLATLLVTPVSKSNIAFGKVIALSVIALCSGTSSYLGVILSLPALLNLKANEIFEIYGINSYLLLFMTLFSVIIIMVAMMAVFSAHARTIKEATTMLSPFAAASMLLGMTCMIQNKPITNMGVYFIPFYNNVQQIYSILNLELNYICFGVMFISNLMYTGVCVFVLSKLFRSERVMFG